MILPLKTYFHLHFFQTQAKKASYFSMCLEHYWRAGVNACKCSVCPHLMISAGGDTLIWARCSELMMSSSARPISRSWAGSQALRTGSSSSSSSTDLLCSSCSLRWRSHISFWRSTTHFTKLRSTSDLTSSISCWQSVISMRVLCTYFSEDHIFLFTWMLCFSSNSCSRVRTRLWDRPDPWSSLDSPFCLFETN